MGRSLAARHGWATAFVVGGTPLSLARSSLHLQTASAIGIFTVDFKITYLNSVRKRGINDILRALPLQEAQLSNDPSVISSSQVSVSPIHKLRSKDPKTYNAPLQSRQPITKGNLGKVYISGSYTQPTNQPVPRAGDQTIAEKKKISDHTESLCVAEDIELGRLAYKYRSREGLGRRTLLE